MEAMRLSLLEEEERSRRRETEERQERQAIERSSSQVDVATVDDQNTQDSIQPPRAAHTVHEAPAMAAPNNVLPERTTSINNNSEHSSLSNEDREQSRLSSDSIDRAGLLAAATATTATESSSSYGREHE